MSYFDDLTERGKKNIYRDDDIIEGEIHYCRKCGAKKTIMNFKNVLVACTCECFKEEQTEQAKADAERLQKRKAHAFTSYNMGEWTFANASGTNAKQMEMMKKYADNWQTVKADNQGLLLWGTVGAGKSFAAACIANAILETDLSAKVIMRSFGYCINEVYKAEARNDFIKKLAECDLLILDDLGTQRTSEYATEQVFNIIDARCNAGRPMVITTNLPLEEIKNPSDTASERIYSRILQMCVPVNFNGEDLRQAAGRAKTEAFKQLIGYGG